MDQDEAYWILGVDWGSEEHWGQLSDHRGQALGRRRVEHSGEGLAQMADWALKLSGAAGPAAIRVAIEVPQGPVVESFMERGFRLFAINPKQADRFRDRRSPAGAKDDGRDADLMTYAYRTDPAAFREIAPADPVVVELREWTRMHAELVRERTRLANQMRDQLWRYYPQMLALADGDLDQPWVLELLALAPTPKEAPRLRRDRVEQLLKRCRIRRIDAARVLEILKAEPIKTAPGTVEAASAHVRLLVKRLTLVGQQVRETEKRLDQLLDGLAQPAQADADAPEGQAREQRDVTILRSLPGIARVVCATLLAEAWEPLQQRNYHALRCLCGVAPVTRSSGKTKLVLRRRAANPRLADAVFHWARVAAQRDPICRAKYAALRRRGHGHARALRGLGNGLLGTLCAMLQTRTLYDPDHMRHTPRAA
jgi:transposase